MLGQVFSCCLAYETYSKCKQHTIEGHCGRRAYALYDVRCRLLTQSGQHGQLLGTQVIQIGYIFYKTIFVEQFYGLATE